MSKHNRKLSCQFWKPSGGDRCHQGEIKMSASLWAPSGSSRRQFLISSSRLTWVPALRGHITPTFKTSIFNLSLLCLHTVFSSRHSQISLQGHFSLHLGSLQIIQGNPPISISLIGSHWQRPSLWFWLMSGNIVTGSMD